MRDVSSTRQIGDDIQPRSDYGFSPRAGPGTIDLTKKRLGAKGYEEINRGIVLQLGYLDPVPQGSTFAAGREYDFIGHTINTSQHAFAARIQNRLRNAQNI